MHYENFNCSRRMMEIMTMQWKCYLSILLNYMYTGSYHEPNLIVSYKKALSLPFSWVFMINALKELIT